LGDPGFRAGLFLIALALFALASEARAQQTQQLQGVEKALQQSREKSAALSADAAKLTKEVAALQNELVRRAAAAQSAEAALSRIEASLADLKVRRTAKAAELAERRQALAASLAALLRLAATPPAAALVSASPVDVARGSLLLSLVVPILQQRAQALEGELSSLAALSSQIEHRQATARDLAAALDLDRRQIATLLAEKSKLRRQTAAEAAASQARSAALAAEAKDLRQLLDKLAAAKPAESSPGLKPGNIRAFPTNPGGLVQPVAGRVQDLFGVPDSTGGTGKGIEIETRPDAAVVAPFDGQILFRGPFRSYGEILIIQHDGGYHSLLAGLARSDAAVGQWVLAGEPVGVMGQSKDGNPKLYMELRRDGRPIDPAPWLGKSDSKVE
jgi:septal ring factor EnvC (AmiA/AmiB activator)